MVKPYRKTVAFVTVLAIIIDALALVKPYLVRVLIDDYLKNGISQNEFMSVSIEKTSHFFLLELINFVF